MKSFNIRKVVKISPELNERLKQKLIDSGNMSFKVWLTSAIFEYDMNSEAKKKREKREEDNESKQKIVDRKKDIELRDLPKQQERRRKGIFTEEEKEKWLEIEEGWLDGVSFEHGLALEDEKKYGQEGWNANFEHIFGISYEKGFDYQKYKAKEQKKEDYPVDYPPLRQRPGEGFGQGAQYKSSRNEEEPIISINEMEELNDKPIYTPLEKGEVVAKKKIGSQIIYSQTEEQKGCFVGYHDRGETREKHGKAKWCPSEQIRDKWILEAKTGPIVGSRIRYRVKETDKDFKAMRRREDKI